MLICPDSSYYPDVGLLVDSSDCLHSIDKYFSNGGSQSMGKVKKQVLQSLEHKTGYTHPKIFIHHPSIQWNCMGGLKMKFAYFFHAIAYLPGFGIGLCDSRELK